jgi:hypothetical protein
VAMRGDSAGMSAPEFGKCAAPSPRSALALSILSLGSALAAPAFAQTAAPDAAASEVIVTGSRIARSGYDTPTPVTVIGEKELEAAAPANDRGRRPRRTRKRCLPGLANT